MENAPQTTKRRSQARLVFKLRNSFRGIPLSQVARSILQTNTSSLLGVVCVVTGCPSLPSLQIFEMQG